MPAYHETPDGMTIYELAGCAYEINEGADHDGRRFWLQGTGSGKVAMTRIGDAELFIAIGLLTAIGRDDLADRIRRRQVVAI